MKRGKLIVVIGAMGSGKSTLMRHAIERFPELVTPYSFTSRARRPDNVENDHYKFVSKEEYEQMIAEGKMLEWANFSGNYYGTLRSEVEEGLQSGRVMFKEMEVQGVRQVRELLDKSELITVFIDGGEWEQLVERARKRADMSEEELEKRRTHYEDELTFMPEADVIIYNREGEKETAKQSFEDVIQNALREVTD